MPTRNINLTDHFDQFVTELVDAGRYKNASEVLRAGLRLLEEQSQADQQKLALLKKLAAEGFDALDKGLGVSFSDRQSLAGAIAQLGLDSAISPSE
jgi:antitoxin ParD1/3/4